MPTLLKGLIPASEPKQFMRLAKTAAIIYKGDTVHFDLSGGAAFRSPEAPAADDTLMGVAMEYAAAADSYITVCTDPSMLYHCLGTEADGTPDTYAATTHLGQWHGLDIGGTPVNFQSDMTVDLETESLSAPDTVAFVQCLGLADVADNSATGSSTAGTPMLLVRLALPAAQTVG